MRWLTTWNMEYFVLHYKTEINERQAHTIIHTTAADAVAAIFKHTYKMIRIFCVVH